MMSEMELNREAGINRGILANNPYPGRGIIVGLDETGNNLVQVYWIMGRSPNSRNRVFGYDEKEGRLFTEAADPSQVKDPSLIIYNAMREKSFEGKSYLSIVSNGAQTDTVMDCPSGRRINDLPVNMSSWVYEPDAPNFTPRITAVSMWMKYTSREAPLFQISILRKSIWSDACDRHLYEFDGVGPGFGYCVTTYSFMSYCNGGPLPSFHGEPYLLPLHGDSDLIADIYWDMLDSDNRVSLAVKLIPRRGPSHIAIINKFQKKV